VLKQLKEKSPSARCLERDFHWHCQRKDKGLAYSTIAKEWNEKHPDAQNQVNEEVVRTAIRKTAARISKLSGG
jgi:hypothetical protein